MKVFIKNSNIVFQLVKSLPSWILTYKTSQSGMNYNNNKQPVDIPQGSRYSFSIDGTGVEQGYSILIYGFYDDGTNEFLYAMPIGTYMSNLTANKNIVAIGVNASSGHITSDSGQVTLEVTQLT